MAKIGDEKNVIMKAEDAEPIDVPQIEPVTEEHHEDEGDRQHPDGKPDVQSLRGKSRHRH